jgi:nucleoside-diphosphate-sugar epimerase
MTTRQRELDNQRTVIVAGAQGVSGRAVLERYATSPGTAVYGLSRRPAKGEGNVRHISVDLLDADDVYTKLGHLKAATHLAGLVANRWGVSIPLGDWDTLQVGRPQRDTASVHG